MTGIEFHCLQFALLAGKHTTAGGIKRERAMARTDENEPLIMTGVKVMFNCRGGWFVGEVLRFDGERERYLIQRQQKGMNLPRVWVDEDLVRPLPNSTPKSGFLGPDG
jgi:hypothetical protein